MGGRPREAGIGIGTEARKGEFVCRTRRRDPKRVGEWRMIVRNRQWTIACSTRAVVGTGRGKRSKRGTRRGEWVEHGNRERDKWLSAMG